MFFHWTQLHCMDENPHFNSENETNLKARTTGLKILKYSTNLIAIVNRSVGSSSSREFAHSTLHIAFFMSLVLNLIYLPFGMTCWIHSNFLCSVQTLSHSIVRSIFMQTCMHFCEEEHFTVHHLLSVHHSMLMLKCWNACRHMAVLLNTVPCTIPCANLH